MNLSCNYIFNINNSTMELVISGFEYVLDVYLPPLIRDTFCSSCVCCIVHRDCTHKYTKNYRYFPFEVSNRRCLLWKKKQFHSRKVHREKISRLGLDMVRVDCTCVCVCACRLLLAFSTHQTGFVETVYRFSPMCDFVPFNGRLWVAVRYIYINVNV